MGKWSTYQKRGGSGFIGSMAPPGVANGGDWTLGVGAVGAINVTRNASIPTGATAMLWRAKDTTTNLMTATGNTVLNGLVSGRVYAVQAAWWNGAQLMSDWSLATNQAAG